MHKLVAILGVTLAFGGCGGGKGPDSADDKDKDKGGAEGDKGGGDKDKGKGGGDKDKGKGGGGTAKGGSNKKPEVWGDDDKKKGGGGGGAATTQGGGGGGASAELAKKFTSWTPLHAFLGAPVVTGSIVSPQEAIVFTKDNHVGVTLDGGQSWSFTRMATGSVRAVAGAPGGPFVVTGAGGFLALSPDGKNWSDQPRYTNDELWAVATSRGIVAAVGKQGSFVKLAATGGSAVSGMLPDKLKAGSVSITPDLITVAAGKKVYASKDGKSWVPVEPPVVTGPKEIPTSQGLCAIGKVGKKKGVVCTVAGTAYGLGAKDTLVIGKAWLALSKNGGQSWTMTPLPMKGIKAVSGKAGGPYQVTDGKTWMTSADGRTWNPEEAVIETPPWPKPAKCEGLPAEATTCTLAQLVTSPEGLPDVRGLRLSGEVALALGDSALLLMSGDGGKSWKAQSGFALGGVQGFDLVGDKIVVVGKTKVAVSVNAGKFFRTVDLPLKTPALLSAKITDGGAVYLTGRAGTILQSDAKVTAFVRLDTGPKNKTDYLALYEIGGALYAAGARGELHRTPDQGRTWTGIATGIPESIQKMTGEGQTVLAVSSPPRYGGNKLLRSDDGGEHFFVQRELSDSGRVNDFELSDGTLRYENLESQDFGATWTRATDWYWSGSVDVADGSGVRITNVGSYNGKDRFYVIGTEKDDYTVVDSFYNKGGWLRCAESSGCWMVASGQLYRPQ